jgi:hypothetical protein
MVPQHVLKTCMIAARRAGQLHDLLTRQSKRSVQPQLVGGAGVSGPHVWAACLDRMSGPRAQPRVMYVRKAIRASTVLSMIASYLTQAWLLTAMVKEFMYWRSCRASPAGTPNSPMPRAVVLLLSEEFVTSPYPSEELRLLLEYGAPAKLLPVPCGVNWEDVEQMVADCKAAMATDEGDDAGDEWRQLWVDLVEELLEYALPEVSALGLASRGPGST